MATESIDFIQSKCVLLRTFRYDPSFGPLVENLWETFCGEVVDILTGDEEIVYLYGDLDKVFEETSFTRDPIIFVIRDLMTSPLDVYPLKVSEVLLGQVPRSVHGVGVMLPQVFRENLFERVEGDHVFQNLTESNKVTKAFRKGIYLTPVTKLDDDLHFHLLRCSSNFEGPTDTFRSADDYIVGTLNRMAPYFFDNPAPINHVLAQIYSNFRVDGVGKGTGKKARIKEHSDKTKDMPSNGIMAFVTLYKDDEKLRALKTPKDDPYDLRHGKESGLTRLRFRLKSCVEDPSLTKKFDVLLYPGSVLLISLATNRYYTHEIVPSILDVEMLPTRMGYVARCSDQEAVFRDGHTLIKNLKGEWVPLEEPTDEGVDKLKGDYYRENRTIDVVDYGFVPFSLNDGDYMQPIV